MKSRRIRAGLGRIAFSLILLASLQARSDDESRNSAAERTLDRDKIALARLQSPPLGLPVVRVPANNVATVEKIALGRKLFFDRRLSFNGTMSCGMCHIPEQGFTNNELSRPIGVGGQSLKRNAPSVLNVAFESHLFRDGRERSLESQAVLPLLARDEMANPTADSLLAKLGNLSDYKGLFEKAFGGGASMDHIGKAIASWERTLLAADSPFDRWRYGGEKETLTAQQKQGAEIFLGKGRCHECHTVGARHALFTDQAFHNTGVAYRRDVAERKKATAVLVEIAPQVFVPVERDVIRQVGQARQADLGRFEVTHDLNDKWRFKTPTLRNVAATAPYMHDGSLRTLDAVVRFYDRGGVAHPGLDPLIKPLGLTEDEIASLVAFLRSLTASNLAALQTDARSAAVGNER
jgi:cytochrome c peroxidase